MSKFKDLYKKNGLTASRRAEQRIDVLNCHRKNQRFHTLDSRREKVTLDFQDSKRNNKTKNTLNDNSKKKWKPIKEQSTMNAHLPPFIVGVVRHKIHSPPFLHESINVTEKKKNCQTSQQSFAPKNYKFKPPKELKTNICTPLKSTHELPSFTFGTLLSKPNKKNANKKDINFSNINIRPRNRKLSYDLSFGSDTVEVREDNNEKNYEKVEKQLSPKASEVPIFGRSNVLKALQKSGNDLSEDLKDQSETNSFCNLEKSIITSPKLNVSKIELGQWKTYQELNTVVNDTPQISPTSAINVPNYKIKNTTPLGINKNVSVQESPKDEKRSIDSNFLHHRITTESLDHNQIENSINSIEKDNKQIHTDIDQTNLSYQQDDSPKIKINTITLQLEGNSSDNEQIINCQTITKLSLVDNNLQDTNNLREINDKNNSKDINEYNLSSSLSDILASKVNESIIPENKNTTKIISEDSCFLSKKNIKPLLCYQTEADGQNNPKVLNDKEVTAEINISSIPVSLRYSNNRCDMITNNSFDHNVNSRNVRKGILSSSLPNYSIENLNNSSKFNNMEMKEESSITDGPVYNIKAKDFININKSTKENQSINNNNDNLSTATLISSNEKINSTGLSQSADVVAAVSNINEELPIIEEHDKHMETSKVNSKETTRGPLRPVQSINKDTFIIVNGKSLLSPTLDLPLSHIGITSTPRTDKFLVGEKNSVNEYTNMTSDESEYSMEKTISLSYQSKLSITNDFRYKEIKEEMEHDVKSTSTTPLNKSPMPKMNSMINEQSINDDSVCSKSDDTIFLSNIMNDQSVDDRVKKPKYLKECHIIVNSPLVKNPLQSPQYNSPADITRTPLIENKNIENDSKSFVIKIEKNVNNESKLLSKTISPLLNRTKQQDSLNSDRSLIKENSEDEIVIYYEFLPNKSSQKCSNVVKVEDGKEYEQSFSNKENSMINEIIPLSSLSKHMADNKIKHSILLKNTLPLNKSKNTNALKEATIINLSNSPELRKQKKLKKSKKRRHCKHNCELSSKRIINTNEVLESNENEMVDLVSTDEEDYTSFLSRLLSKYTDTSTSPNPNKEKNVKRSIENISKVDGANVVESPLRILTLRNRTIPISPIKTPSQERNKKTNKSFKN